MNTEKEIRQMELIVKKLRTDTEKTNVHGSRENSLKGSLSYTCRFRVKKTVALIVAFSCSINSGTDGGTAVEGLTFEEGMGSFPRSRDFCL